MSHGTGIKLNSRQRLSALSVPSHRSHSLPGLLSSLYTLLGLLSPTIERRGHTHTPTIPFLSRRPRARLHFMEHDTNMINDRNEDTSTLHTYDIVASCFFIPDYIPLPPILTCVVCRPILPPPWSLHAFHPHCLTGETSFLPLYLCCSFLRSRKDPSWLSFSIIVPPHVYVQ